MNEQEKNYFMQIAINEAKKAERKNEVPIGAVVVKNGKIISKAFNNREKKQNAINHAEVIAISRACKKLKSWRLSNCSLFVTLEPCLMCFGAILNSRIENVYFGAYDKSNSSITAYPELLSSSKLNHKTNIEGGILKDKCSQILSEFFKNKRKNFVEHN